MNRPEKFPFVPFNLIVLALPWSVKHFFAPNLPIFWKSRIEEGEEK